MEQRLRKSDRNFIGTWRSVTRARLHGVNGKQWIAFWFLLQRSFQDSILPRQSAVD
jgi:hypothetical protein